MIKSGNIKSFSDYERLISEVTLHTSALRGFRFGTWCIQRFREAFFDDISDGLNETECQQLEAAVQELQRAAVASVLIAPERAQILNGVIDAFGPEDEYADDATELGATAINYLGLISSTLHWCIRQDPSDLCRISEQLINELDYRQEDPDYGLTNNMFTFPELQGELELQLMFLNEQA
jgi:hypothetical protein